MDVVNNKCNNLLDRLHGHILGKTVLLQAHIVRQAHKIVSDTESSTKHLMILVIWQRGADALLCQYRDLASSLPTGANLEVMVLTKDELMKKFKATDVRPNTTDEINMVCRNIGGLIKDKIVHLCIDECWITAPKTFSAHMTQVWLHILRCHYLTIIMPRLIQMMLLVIFRSSRMVCCTHGPS